MLHASWRARVYTPHGGPGRTCLTEGPGVHVSRPFLEREAFPSRTDGPAVRAVALVGCGPWTLRQRRRGASGPGCLRCVRAERGVGCLLRSIY